MAHFYARYGLGESSAYDPNLMTELGEAVADVVGLDTWHEVRAKWVQILGRYLKPSAPALRLTLNTKMGPSGNQREKQREKHRQNTAWPSWSPRRTAVHCNEAARAGIAVVVEHPTSSRGA